ncbi:glycosyltransferase [Ferroacidibacillus organovorans]|uniref:glycosyltransferase n=1 Tax=Ferroacidibacillus organovorans TaxID=1765683 RepID=UPI001365867F|nr:glycosyltransferase family 2 protein [Ferroacidibacillus organovorans]
MSIIVPTFNEMENVGRVSNVVRESMEGIDYELIFIDDSSDDTPIELEQLASQDNCIRYEHRVNERGLGTAVVRGFQLALGDVIAVMDADLQHPASMLPAMLEQVDHGAEVVIASRFIPGGSDGGLSLNRKIISGVARYLSRILLHRIRPIKDPTSGFFMFRREVIDTVELRPIGWKILIEVLARGKSDKVVEVPYDFHARSAGESKMSLREQWNYMKHLFILMKDSPIDLRLYSFLAVGLSGVVVNLAAYMLFVRIGIPILISGFLSALVALFSNFLLNDKITWRDVHISRWHLRATKYFLVSVGGIIFDIGVLDMLFRVFHLNYLFANVAGIIVASVWNFLLNNLWTWNNNKKSSMIRSFDDRSSRESI